MPDALNHATFSERLMRRAKAFVSDPDAVLASDINTAVTEAIEIAGENNPMPVLMDIGFYRFLLLVETNGVSEEQFKAYLHALKRIKDPDSPTLANAISRSKTRPNSYL